MIKLFAILLLVCAVTSFHHKSRRSTRYNNVIDEARSLGYSVENYTVVTTDGYQLDMFRINQKPVTNKQDSDSDSSSSASSWSSEMSRESDSESQSKEKRDSPSSPLQDGKRQPVLLMHGLMSSCDDFVVGGQSEGLAFVLADRGYDVFLGNMRGSVYGRKHNTLNPDRDAKFWDYCWHESGVLDLPAIVDKILDVTKMQKIHYIGHTLGTTVFYVMASEKPEYNNKFYSMISMGPMAITCSTDNYLMKMVAINRKHSGWVMKNMGVNEFLPKSTLMEASKSDCMSNSGIERICANPFFLINDYMSDYYNMTTVNKAMSYLPSGASIKQILHLAQLSEKCGFMKYNTTEQYRVSKITTKIMMITTPRDTLSKPTDISAFRYVLPNRGRHVEMAEYANNLDLVFGKNLWKVNEVVLSLLKEGSEPN